MHKQPNILLHIHTILSGLPVLFREKVCEECNWSTPTFYRKMREKDRPSTSEAGKMIPALSNAEKQKILAIMEEVYTSGEAVLEKYRKASE
ncbi:hypothetical protein ACDQ55_04510 [Chitinophaga sp. 30R24]|uniref:hypothetical protein n=1 Tax=Chitinophaga sp. 30R24 TaxID=3248838 RepID=UPI003B9150C2